MEGGRILLGAVARRVPRGGREKGGVPVTGREGCKGGSPAVGDGLMAHGHGRACIYTNMMCVHGYGHVRIDAMMILIMDDG